MFANAAIHNFYHYLLCKIYEIYILQFANALLILCC